MRATEAQARPSQYKCRATIGPSAKRHSNCVSLTGRWWSAFVCLLGTSHSLRAFALCTNVSWSGSLHFCRKLIFFLTKQCMSRWGVTYLSVASRGRHWLPLSLCGAWHKLVNIWPVSTIAPNKKSEGDHVITPDTAVRGYWDLGVCYSCVTPSNFCCTSHLHGHPEKKKKNLDLVKKILMKSPNYN